MQTLKLLNSITPSQKNWSKLLNYDNVYLDPYKYHITENAKVDDQEAYESFPKYRHFYDKLWVAKTQNIKCGKLEDILINTNSVEYPIFIKPRSGNLTASSHNCYKINNSHELSKYKGYKDMMWSEYVDGREGMTDLIILNGRIVYQLTYLYSEKQRGFSEVWKYVSPKTKTPNFVTEWANKYVHNDYTGFLNIQYRNNKIIEVGLRPARKGVYLIAVDNFGIMKNIDNAINHNYWDYSLTEKMNFNPYFNFKCYTRMPIIYLWPRTLLNKILNYFTDMPLFEYYFEPVNNEGFVFLQFMHNNFEEGMRAKNIIELLFSLTQIIFIVGLAIMLTILIIMKSRNKYIFAGMFIMLYFTRFLNPIFPNKSIMLIYLKRILKQTY